MTVDATELPPLREVIARYGLAARKSLGQNFLLDVNLTRRIARAGGPLENVTVIEVGPGPGGLTRGLLIEGAARVIAIERDDRCLAALDELARAFPGQLEVISGDALKIDMAAIAARTARPVRIVANLPYNIATPLLTGWLTCSPWPPWYESMTLMFQKEVAERIVAVAGTRAYGRLSVLVQARCTARVLFDIGARAFTPPPKVTSTVVQLVPKREEGPACAIGTLERVTAAAFGQRRKMLRSSLKSLTRDAETLLADSGIAGDKRAEELSVNEYRTLANVYENLSSSRSRPATNDSRPG